MNLEDLYRLLRSSHVQAQGIVDTIDDPLLVLDEHGCVLDANRAFFGTFLVERDDTIGKPLRNLGNGQWNIPELTKLLSDVLPRASAVVDYEVTHEFPNIGSRTFLLTARRLWRPDNNATSVLLVFSDVTEDREKERESSLLFSELRHRMKNLLGVVHALANQTDTRGKTAEEYKAAFLGRFEALMKAEALVANGGEAVDLRDLISNVVEGLGGSRLRLTGGPPATVAEKQIVPLTMILHELGANALKYGAFSDEKGTVDVSWRIESQADAPLIRLVWREETSFPVSNPERTGIGADLIRNSAKLGLHGTVDLDFRSEGLVVTLAMPLARDGARKQPD